MTQGDAESIRDFQRSYDLLTWPYNNGTNYKLFRGYNLFDY